MEAAERPDGGDWLVRRPLRAPLRRLLLDPVVGPGEVSALRERIEELEALLGALATPADGHVLFVPSPDGYSIVESAEPPPPPGQLLFVDGRQYAVAGVRRSPFPGDRRPCLVLEATGVGAKRSVMP
jgi:hypothetical protein